MNEGMWAAFVDELEKISAPVGRLSKIVPEAVAAARAAPVDPAILRRSMIEQRALTRALARPEMPKIQGQPIINV